MHPEVVQDNPGRCRECGMNLVVTKETTPSAPDKDYNKHHNHN